jgi:agmatine deiminase
MSRSEIEEELGRMLGIRKVIWLPGNPSEVETNGHVDGIASFIGEGRVLVQSALPDQGEYFRTMQENRRALELATDASGRHFEFLELPSPIVSERFGSERYCDCYANYVLVNGAVVSTAFGVAEDVAARAVFAKAFPGRAIELLPVTAISMGGGSLHCSTQQQPSTTSA